MKNNNDTSSISFTAHYTGFVWYRYGLSDPAFATAQGRVYYSLLRPFECLSRRILGTDIKTTLLQRHYLIDHELESLVTRHPDLQVLELACGLSPRGYRYARRHPGITYVEADLPGMAARKRGLLTVLPACGDRHRVVTCNILDTEGGDSIEAVIAREFSPSRPLLVITEGLVNYFELPVISGVWTRIAAVLRTFSPGVYLTDIYPEVGSRRFAGLIRSANSSLRVASRSRFTLHFGSDEAMRGHFAQLGFGNVAVLDPDHEPSPAPAARGGAIVRVVKATG